MGMLSCFLDFGNSRVKAWLCQDGEILARVSHGSALDMATLFRVMPPAFRQKMDFVGVASVLDPDINEAFVLEAAARWGVQPVMARSQSESCGVINAYRDPSLLGVDRWMNVLGVAGEGSRCVVSCGTALTIDLVDNQSHLGGYILPGMFLQLESLIKGTRKVRPDVVAVTGLEPGRSTTEAVHHGILMGQSAVVERSMSVLKTLSGKEPRLVLTGGDADKLSPHLSCPHDIIPELVLLGLQRYFGQALSR